MAVDTFIVFAGVYDTAADAEADYEVVKDLHTKAGLIDAYDAAVIVRRADGSQDRQKHETLTRVRGVWAPGWAWRPRGAGTAPVAAVGGGLLAITAGGGASRARWPVTPPPG
jgi:hypothetical protein